MSARDESVKLDEAERQFLLRLLRNLRNLSPEDEGMADVLYEKLQP